MFEKGVKKCLSGRRNCLVQLAPLACPIRPHNMRWHGVALALSLSKRRPGIMPFIVSMSALANSRGSLLLPGLAPSPPLSFSHSGHALRFMKYCGTHFYFLDRPSWRNGGWGLPLRMPWPGHVLWLAFQLSCETRQFNLFGPAKSARIYD